MVRVQLRIPSSAADRYLFPLKETDFRRVNRLGTGTLTNPTSQEAKIFLFRYYIFL